MEMPDCEKKEAVVECGASGSGLKTKPLIIGTCMVLIVIAFAVVVFRKETVFQLIVRDGYRGTQEQWLASLVGQEIALEGNESADELAVKNGYAQSEQDWIMTLIGVQIESVQESPYALACANGFEGSLTEWLTNLADQPEKLGKSARGEPKTEYELACEYGFNGTFIEWLVSITHDRVFE